MYRGKCINHIPTHNTAYLQNYAKNNKDKQTIYNRYWGLEMGNAAQLIVKMFMFETNKLSTIHLFKLSKIKEFWSLMINKSCTECVNLHGVL